jgi:GTP cyclohydrolase I
MAIELPTAQNLERPLSNEWIKGEGSRPAAELGIQNLLRFIGEDPGRDGLVDTPKRVVKAFREMTEGYWQSPSEILTARFEADYDEMVILRDIDFTSLCEHHLLPFVGTATVAYIPQDQVVGLSKLARLTHCFSRRLQLQERMTTQIADAIVEHLNPVGVGVIVKAGHQCMACRGVKVAGATMVTSALRGEFHEASVRAEFLRLAYV